MTLKSHVKIEEKRTCGLENGMRNLAVFTRVLLKSLQSILTKVYNF